MRRALRPPLLAQIAVSAGLIALLVWRTDLASAATVVKEANYVFLAAAFPLFVAANLLGGYRWHIEIGRPERPSVSDLFGVYLVAVMMNRIMPVRVGDILRLQVPSRRWGLTRTSQAALVFVTETLLDGFAFVILVVAMLAFLGLPPLPLALVWALTTLVLVGIVAATVAARLELTEGWQDRGWFKHLPEVVRRHAALGVPQFLDGLLALRNLRVAARAQAVTIGGWLLNAGMYYLFGRTFGLDLSPAEALIVTMTATIIVSVPLVPSSFGTYEIGIAGVLVLMGTPGPDAVAYAFGSHIFSIVFAVAAGIPAMWLIGLGPGDVFFLRTQADREGEAPSGP